MSTAFRGPHGRRGDGAAAQFGARGEVGGGLQGAIRGPGAVEGAPGQLPPGAVAVVFVATASGAGGGAAVEALERARGPQGGTGGGAAEGGGAEQKGLGGGEE